jgi:hypothetical protein
VVAGAFFLAFYAFLTSDADNLSVILRRLDEFASLSAFWRSYGPPQPSAIRHAVAIFQGKD